MRSPKLRPFPMYLFAILITSLRFDSTSRPLAMFRSSSSLSRSFTIFLISMVLNPKVVSSFLIASDSRFDSAALFFDFLALRSSSCRDCNRLFTFFSSLKNAFTTSSSRFNFMTFSSILFLLSSSKSNIRPSFLEVRHLLSTQYPPSFNSFFLFKKSVFIPSVIFENFSFSTSRSSSDSSSPSCTSSINGASPFSMSLPNIMSLLKINGIVNMDPHITRLHSSICFAISISPSLVRRGIELIPLR